MPRYIARSTDSLYRIGTPTPLTGPTDGRTDGLTETDSHLSGLTSPSVTRTRAYGISTSGDHVTIDEYLARCAGGATA